MEIRRAVAGKVPPRTEITVKLDFLEGEGRAAFPFSRGRTVDERSVPEKTREEEETNGGADSPPPDRCFLFRAEKGLGEGNSRANNVRDVIKGVAPRDRETRRKWRIDEIRDIGGNLLPEIYFPLHAPRLVCLVS